ncbi:hypothetical protein GHT06_012665 [Daphnia sinensis]|uniref:Uncharacterized protein n=1 Tax=Daphnia sinensis TaxID=1820382 RepID=A0AAD5Q000_9CRUS|nr:hypothetical protein GHT06_012665 [Daphnia sinensis]
MEKSKRCYPTRSNKIAKLEENEIPGKKSPALSKIKNVESPAAVKHFMISGYASPPCRHVTLSQQNENEIIWDLTSPGARKYQGLLSDKKTSTPNQTPTRKRELRPRVALCKKNIALSEDKSGDLVDQLAALNELVNTEQAQIIMTPPRSVKGSATDSCELLVDKKKSPQPVNLSTSDAFDDDSFFSESVLLSTQALEEEAIGCKPTPPKKCKNELLITPSSPTSNSSQIFSFALTSPEQSVFRKSFDLESEEPSEKISNKNVTKLVPQVVDHKVPVQKDEKKTPLCSQARILNNTTACPNPSSLTKEGKSDSCHIVRKSVPKILEKQILPANKVGTSVATVSNQRHQITNSTSGNKNPFHNSSRSEKPTSPRQLTRSGYSLGNKRIVDDQICNKKPVHQTSCLPPPPKFMPPDPFGDDDDDLLCAMTAIAQEVESQYVPASCATELDDDDVDFQPEVLAFISQIETQAIKTEKPTAELMEEKRQAAIRKRQQRLMSRH